jgi:hypothetical protein
METFLKYFFYVTSFSLLSAFGWYTELAIFEDYGYFYSLLAAIVFILFILAAVFLAFRPFTSGRRFHPLVIALLVCCLSFLSGTQLFRIDLPGVNRVLELSIYNFRENFFGYTMLKVKRMIESREVPSKVVNVITETESGQTNVQFSHPFDKRVLIKFGERPAFIATNFEGASPVVSSLDQSDADLSMRPFAFPDQETILSFSETLASGGDMLGQKLSRLRINDSKTEYTILWETELDVPVHHWGDVFDGKVFIPGRKFVSLPNPVSISFDQSSYSQCKNDWSFDETIEIFSLQDGTHLESIEILPILSQTPHGEFARFLNHCIDPIHLNDVQILTHEQAKKGFFPEGNPGDMLISMRDINTVALIDQHSHKVKWISTKFSAQHSPRITNYGTILVFDNLASNDDYGSSRITELDIATKKILGIWEGTKFFHFQSKEAGRLQILNNTIFVQESDKGRLFELVCPERPLSPRCKNRMIVESPYSNMYVAEVIH